MCILQYVRVAHTTSEQTLKELLTKPTQWNLKLPPIIISVTGGARDFKMRSRLTKEFQKSLVKAAESTGRPMHCLSHTSTRLRLLGTDI